jgi:hypothetical protein|tara:strand:+ start:1223 stop:2194 length:972 start_codon:yes stop_codon:yes gene_type:complete
MDTHIVNLNDYRSTSSSSHPLDLIETPEIVDVKMEERAIYYPDSYGNIVSDPDRKGIHRVGGDAAVNIVGKNSYSIEGGQYSDLYRCMTNVLKNSGVDCAGVKIRSDVTADGALGYVSMTLPEYTIEVANGDESQFQISGRTSFNGIWPTVIQIGAIRIICTNTQAFVENFSMYSAKHTPSFDIDHAQRKLQKALSDYRAEGERWKRWTRYDISDREAFNVFALAAKCKVPLSVSDSVSVSDLINDKERYSEVSRNQSLMYLWGQYKQETKTLGKTHWAAYNAMTHWSTHMPIQRKTAKNNIISARVNREVSVRSAAKEMLAA